jgi:hypothetical protein
MAEPDSYRHRCIFRDEPRYTFIWWGDGYFVYDGDTYLGKDDQVDPIRMMVESGVARKIDYEDEEPEWGCRQHECMAMTRARGPNDAHVAFRTTPRGSTR